MIDPDGNSMIDEDNNSKEVHYMQVESEMEKFHINMASVVKMMKAMMRIRDRT